MQDEAPDGQPQDVGGGQGGEPGSAWWPWPESQADDDATGHRDGAPGGDETLTFPAQEPADEVVQVPEPVLPEPVLEEPVLENPVIEEPVAAVLASAPQPSPDPVPATVVAVADEAIVAASPSGTSEVAGVAESSVVGPMIQNPDVPRDYVPPAEGVDEVGSIPAVSANRVWSKGQLRNWRLHLVRFVSAGVSVILAVVLVPGLSFTAWRWGQGLEIAVIFGLLNTFIKPILQFVSLRFIFSSFGVVIVVINAFLLWLLGATLDGRLVASSILALLLGGALAGIIGGFFDALMGADYPMLDRDYKERNGLA